MLRAEHSLAHTIYKYSDTSIKLQKYINFKQKDRAWHSFTTCSYMRESKRKPPCFKTSICQCNAQGHTQHLGHTALKLRLRRPCNVVLTGTWSAAKVRDVAVEKRRRYRADVRRTSHHHEFLLFVLPLASHWSFKSHKKDVMDGRRESS